MSKNLIRHPMAKCGPANDWFDGFFDDFLGSSWPGFRASAPALTGGSSQWVPSVDIHEEDDAYVVSAALPGVEKKDIKVEIDGNVLTISGERKVAENSKLGSWLRRERSIGRFFRSFELPGKIDSDKVGAEHKNGLLEIRLPKTEAAKARHIDVR